MFLIVLSPFHSPHNLNNAKKNYFYSQNHWHLAENRIVHFLLLRVSSKRCLFGLFWWCNLSESPINSWNFKIPFQLECTWMCLWVWIASNDRLPWFWPDLFGVEFVWRIEIEKRTMPHRNEKKLNLIWGRELDSIYSIIHVIQFILIRKEFKSHTCMAYINHLDSELGGISLFKMMLLFTQSSFPPAF